MIIVVLLLYIDETKIKIINYSNMKIYILQYVFPVSHWMVLPCILFIYTGIRASWLWYLLLLLTFGYCSLETLWVLMISDQSGNSSLI